MDIDFHRLLLLIPPLLLALSAHECAHAWVALRLGDKTSYMMGRVTLNPIKHLDPFGTLAIIITQMFGWAKPVPVNPRNLKHPIRDMMYVSIAGPATNLLLAAVFAGIYKLMLATFDPRLLVAPDGVIGPVFSMVVISIWLNVGLAVFNMLPIHPLDGAAVLGYFLPTEMYVKFRRYEHYGFLILITLLITGLTKYILVPPVRFIVKFLTGGSM